MKDDEKVITIDDVHALVDAKNRDPRIAPEELYRQIDRVQADISGEMWKLLWLPIAFAILSLLGMTFLVEKREWYRLSIIGFVISSLWGIYLLRKYKKEWWWIPILDIVFLYLIIAESLSLKELIQYITSLL